jgi:protein-S-isoprenylcysteine O-methyltransferase Ste14
MHNNTIRRQEKMAVESEERIRLGFLKVAGYLVPLVQSLPAWTGLMTLPFASYLIIIFTNLPVNLPRALFDFFTPFLIPEKALIIIGFMIFVYSVAYLRMKKKEGFVASGPYGLVRHPQYLGMILSTLGLTSCSVWILNNTFGVGFLSPSQTIGMWFIELFAYILLAFIEELYLSRKHGEPFESYKRQVPFFIPFLKTNRKDLDILISILGPTILLFGLIVGFH